MVILDTDHLTFLERPDSPEARRLSRKLSELAQTDVVTSVITYEEQTRGWFAVLSKARTVADEISAYGQLRNHLDMYKEIPVLAYDEVAATHYQRLRSMRIRVSAMDLKIASIALAHNAALLTRNSVDFRRVPDLRIDDWTV